MQTMHLFAGAGGGLLADLILGHTPICAVEWDAYCCQVLRERAADGWFPNLSVWEGDIRMFDPSEYKGRVDCIHAGFPCQDLSVAGKGAGLGDGTRSGLYREVLRIAGVIRPQYLFLENVSAIRSKGLEVILSDLAALGFDARWCCIRASECGAPHRRDRWFLLANASSGRRGSESEREIQQQGRTEVVSPSDDVAYTEQLHVEGDKPGGVDTQGRQEQEERPAGSCGNGSNWWQIESLVGRVVDGLANRAHRLKALGNGQVPLQAAVAWKILGGP